jgi:hypothetical protein
MSSKAMDKFAARWMQATRAQGQEGMPCTWRQGHTAPNRAQSRHDWNDLLAPEQRKATTECNRLNNTSRAASPPKRTGHLGGSARQTHNEFGKSLQRTAGGYVGGSCLARFRACPRIMHNNSNTLPDSKEWLLSDNRGPSSGARTLSRMHVRSLLRALALQH